MRVLYRVNSLDSSSSAIYNDKVCFMHGDETPQSEIIRGSDEHVCPYNIAERQIGRTLI